MEHNNGASRYVFNSFLLIFIIFYINLVKSESRDFSNKCYSFDLSID